MLYWSTWCKPCEEELPQIRALYSQYHSQGFEILGVNLDTTADPVDAFEMRRNDVIYESYQFNRNPFVDHPEWATEIWGSAA